MAKPTRTPERAAAVLDRAARMPRFQPAWYDRGLFDTRMRTPGVSQTPWHNHDIDPKSIRALGVQDVPLAKVRTEQTTVSVAGVKEKLLPGARSSSTLPQVIRKGDLYYVLDGNHRITGARALGQTTLKAHVGEIARQAQAAMAKPITAAPRTHSLTAAGKASLAVTAALPVITAGDAFARSMASGASVSEAMGAAAVEGMKTAAAGAVAAGMMTAVSKIAAAAAPRLAPALGPVGWAAAGGMAAWGAYRGYQATGTIVGAARGALGLDTTTARLAEMQANSTQQRGADSRGIEALGDVMAAAQRHARPLTTRESAHIEDRRGERYTEKQLADRETAADAAYAKIQTDRWKAMGRPARGSLDPQKFLDEASRLTRNPEQGRPGGMSMEKAQAFERADADFAADAVRALAGARGKSTNRPKGYANPSTQYAAQAARGVTNFSDWAQPGKR